MRNFAAICAKARKCGERISIRSTTMIIFGTFLTVSSSPTAQVASSPLLRDFPSLELRIGRFEYLGSTSELSPLFNEVVAHVGARVGIFAGVAGANLLHRNPSNAVPVTFLPAESYPCHSRGISVLSIEHPEIHIYVDNDTSRRQLLGVLAHELGHQFQFSTIDGGKHITGMFNEGFATWLAGRYWLEWHGYSSLDDAIRTFLAEGTYLPLNENYLPSTFSEDAQSEDCIRRRDTLYTEWAAFFDYLLGAYGKDDVDALFQTAAQESLSRNEAPRPVLPNFRGAYGRTLSQLEADWLEEIGE